MQEHYQVIIVGGGLAGLTSAIHLSQAGMSVLVLEKDVYPRHRVCGEYVSNEVLPYLTSLGAAPRSLGVVAIDRFQFTTTSNKAIETKLPLGGFGVSRYALDYFLYEKAIESGAEIEVTKVTDISFSENRHTVTTLSRKCTATYVIGAYGKRSALDITLSRKFIKNKSPWLAVKAHYKIDFPDDLVALHHFKGGYCGLSQTETGAVNACYLTHTDVFREYQDLEAFQKVILEKNTALKIFFDDAQLLFEKPLAISQVSFESKSPVHHHIFMIGDTAGLIYPLCGNGMAMAIHSAKIISELIVENVNSSYENRLALEKEYDKKWHRTFDRRLKMGAAIQKALQNQSLTNVGLSVLRKSPYLLKSLITKTHGNPI